MKNEKQIVPSNPYSYPRPKSGFWQHLFAAGLTFGLTAVLQSARAVPSYGTAVLYYSPLAFWQLNETGNLSSGTLKDVVSFGHGSSATCGATPTTQTTPPAK